jgi:hypothetical protein
MRAYKTKPEDRGKPKVTIWANDWGAMMGGVWMYSQEEEISRTVSADNPIDTDTLKNIKARFRWLLLIFITFDLI